MDHGTSRRRLVLTALVVAALITTVAARPAGAHPYVPRYQYDKVVWHYGWRSSPTLVAEHDQWHRNHPNTTLNRTSIITTCSATSASYVSWRREWDRGSRDWNRSRC